MSTSSRRKQPPQVGEDDRPQEAFNGEGPGRAVTPRQPEPTNFVDHIDYSKLQFGQKLIGWCLFFIIALSLVGYFVEKEGTQLSVAIELLKLVTTTALGFVFAKTQAQAPAPKDDS